MEKTEFKEENLRYIGKNPTAGSEYRIFEYEGISIHVMDEEAKGQRFRVAAFSYQKDLSFFRLEITKAILEKLGFRIDDPIRKDTEGNYFSGDRKEELEFFHKEYYIQEIVDPDGTFVPEPEMTAVSKTEEIPEEKNISEEPKTQKIYVEMVEL